MRKSSAFQLKRNNNLFNACIRHRSADSMYEPSKWTTIVSKHILFIHRCQLLPMNAFEIWLHSVSWAGKFASKVSNPNGADAINEFYYAECSRSFARRHRHRQKLNAPCNGWQVIKLCSFGCKHEYRIYMLCMRRHLPTIERRRRRIHMHRHTQQSMQCKCEIHGRIHCIGAVAARKRIHENAMAERRILICNWHIQPKSNYVYEENGIRQIEY